MIALLRFAAPFVPPFVKKHQVKNLLRLTADAFGTSAPSVQGLSFDETLRSFASFTNDEAVRAIGTGEDMSDIQARLYHGAFALGSQCRKWFRIREGDDVMTAAQVLYAFCGIDFQGSKDGGFTINRCFFSEYYSGAVCRVISSLDAGLLAGLSGGRQLSFSARITEGAPACIGLLAERESI
ncbi:MAG: hypothetical protein IT282_05120 [Bacteroidetes bacterium]|nr:hypothetical protein [Bacteroidota bacterium]